MADVNREIGTSTLDTTYIQNRALKTLEKRLVVTELATPGELPMNAGSTLRWHHDTAMSDAAAFQALTNTAGTGTSTFAARTTNEETFATTAVEAQIETYGVFVPVRRSDLKQMPKSVMDRIAKRVAYRGAEVLDRLHITAGDGEGTAYRPSMGAGSTNRRASAGGAGGDDGTIAADDFLTAEDIFLAVGDLEGNDANTFDNGLYHAVIHSGAATHLKTDVSTTRISWFEAVKHTGGFSGMDKILNGTIGNLGGCAVSQSNNCSTGVTIDTFTSHLGLVLSDEGLGNVQQDMARPTVVINKSTSATISDPYREYATVAFKFMAGVTLIDSARVIVLESKD